MRNLSIDAYDNNNTLYLPFNKCDNKSDSSITKLSETSQLIPMVHFLSPFSNNLGIMSGGTNYLRSWTHCNNVCKNIFISFSETLSLCVLF